MLSPERPGCGENVFLTGLEQWKLCIGDVFTGAAGVVLQVTGSPLFSPLFLGDSTHPCNKIISFVPGLRVRGYMLTSIAVCCR